MISPGSLNDSIQPSAGSPNYHVIRTSQPLRSSVSILTVQLLTALSKVNPSAMYNFLIDIFNSLLLIVRSIINIGITLLLVHVYTSIVQ